MAKTLIATLTLLLLSASGLAADGKWGVRLKEHVTVNGESVALRDVVDPDGTDLDFVKTYGNLRFTDLQENAESIDQTAVLGVLVRAGADLSAIRFKDNASVSLERGQKIDLTDAQKNSVINAVAAAFAVPKSDIALESARILPKLPASAKDGFKLEKPAPTDFSSLDRAKMTVVVRDLDGNVTAHQLFLKLSIETAVASAVSDVEAGDALSEEQYVLGTAKLEGLKDRLVAAGDLSGKTVKAVSEIRKGDILFANMVREARQIKKGSSVTLSYETASLKIQTQGTLLDSGEIGSLVTVENSESKRTVKGRLVSKDLVEVANVQ